jgi:hypothetical protein
MKGILFLTLVFFSSVICAQQTVGSLLNTEDSYQGYTIISPSSYKASYLINNCGEVINSWESDFFVALMAEIDLEGNLFRTMRLQTEGGFVGGGIGGGLEKFSWDGELLWTGDFADEMHHSHHDLSIMPNGNVLLIQWDKIPAEDVFANGRSPMTFGDDSLWPDKIIEVEILDNNEYNIVWEWRAWDHIVQDYDSSLPNFGEIHEHPEKINLNLIPTEGGNDLSDWMHTNGVDYNEELDLVVISLRHFSEIMVIDHSTTTEEAAGSTGGNFGMGGDLLYRYGNPANYNLGTVDDQMFFGQHDSRWHFNEEIEQWQISVFNNGVNRPGGGASTAEIITLPLEGNTFLREENQAFGPEEIYFSFPSIPDTSLFASRVCGAQILPNNNILYAAGAGGTIWEVTQESEDLVYDYQMPVGIAGPLEYNTPNFNTNYFKVTRYSEDYPGFEGKDMTPGDYIELNNPGGDCIIYENQSNDTTSVFERFEEQRNLLIYPNPASSTCQIDIPGQGVLNIYNALGKLHDSIVLNYAQVLQLDISFFTKGMYYVNFSGQESSNTKLIIK